MKPWLDDGDVQFWHGDVVECLRALPAGVAQTCVTSPPYWGLRDYGTGEWTGGDAECDHKVGRFTTPVSAKQASNGGSGDQAARDECPRCGARRVDQQLGLEASPELYVERMVAVFREVWRVLRDDGSLWLNLGDSYAANRSYQVSDSKHLAHDYGASNAQTIPPGLKPKDLVGIPWRVAFALQADGWYLRSDIVWSKPNPMPESVSDRPTKAHEYVFLLSKRPRYFYDSDAVREPHQWAHDYPANGRKGVASRRHAQREEEGKLGGGHSYSTAYLNPAGRNLRSVWEVATEPFPEAHFATYPQALVRRCILAGTSEHGECSACGAPWVRETEAEYVKSPVHGAGSVIGRHQATGANGWDGSGLPRLDKKVTTTGWRPSCSCDAPARPQTVLDPFIGSGTTALVARKHGRRCIGIDLSAEYLDIAARRTQQLSLLGGAA